MRQALQFSGSPRKDFKSLISSIENKLTQLAADELALPTSCPQHSPSHSFLALEDLSVAHSPVLDHLGKMQTDYIGQIVDLNQKLLVIEAENSHLRQLNIELESTVSKLQSEVNRLERAEQGKIREKIEEIQASLARRWRVEVQQEIGSYVQELEAMREEISELRRCNRQLLKQKEILFVERNNLDYLYREMLDKYKMDIQADIDSFQQEQATQQRSTKVAKDRGGNSDIKSKERHPKVQKLSRDELVPFLTKGIEELKEKLKMKRH